MTSTNAMISYIFLSIAVAATNAFQLPSSSIPKIRRRSSTDEYIINPSMSNTALNGKLWKRLQIEEGEYDAQAFLHMNILQVRYAHSLTFLYASL
jgi:hypothetical protein